MGRHRRPRPPAAERGTRDPGRRSRTGRPAPDRPRCRSPRRPCATDAGPRAVRRLSGSGASRPARRSLPGSGTPLAARSLRIGGRQGAAACDHDRRGRRTGQSEHQRERHQDRAAGPDLGARGGGPRPLNCSPSSSSTCGRRSLTVPHPPPVRAPSVPPSARSPRETRARAATSEIPRSCATSA